MNKFIVNEFITLRFDRGITDIYVNNIYFNQCRCVVYDIHIEDINTLDEIESFDEIEERLDRKIVEISPKTKFWAQCSTLQVWAENNYNTRLLPKSIAFSLLKKLSKAGDTRAIVAFKKELVKRIKSGYLSVIMFLIKEKYLKYLDEDWCGTIFLDSNPVLRQNLINASKKEETLHNFVLPILERLIILGDVSSTKLLKDITVDRFKEGTYSEFILIIRNVNLRLLPIDEKEDLFKQINKILIYSYQDFLKKLPKAKNSILYFLKELIHLGNTIAIEKLKEEIIKFFKEKDFRTLNYFSGRDYHYLDYVDSKDVELMVTDHNLQLLDSYIEYYKEEYKKEIEETENSINMTSTLQSFKDLRLLEIPFSNWDSIITDWIRNIEFTKLVLLFSKGFFNFLPKTYFKSLVLKLDLNIIEKLMKNFNKASYYKKEAISSAIKKISNKCPEILYTFFKNCYDNKDFKTPLKVIGETCDISTEIILSIFNTSKLADIFIHTFQKQDESLLKLVEQIFRDNLDLLFSLTKELAHQLSEEGQINLIYFIFFNGLLINVREESIAELITFFENNISLEFPKDIFTIFSNYLNENKYTVDSLFENYYIFTVKQVIDIALPSLRDVIQKEIVKLLNLNHASIFIRLIWERLLYFLPIEEKRKYFDKYILIDLLKSFEDSIYTIDFFLNPISLDYIYTQFLEFGEKGVNLLLESFMIVNIWDFRKDLAYIFRDNFKIVKEAIINAIINREYEFIRVFFEFDIIIELLDDKDIYKIIKILNIHIQKDQYNR